MTTVGAVRGLHLAVFFLGIFLARIFLGAGQGTAFFQRGRIGFVDIVRFVGLVRCHAGRFVVRRGLRVCLCGSTRSDSRSPAWTRRRFSAAPERGAQRRQRRPKNDRTAMTIAPMIQTMLFMVFPFVGVRGSIRVNEAMHYTRVGILYPRHEFLPRLLEFPAIFN